MDTEKDFLKRDLEQATGKEEVEVIVKDAQELGHEDIVALAQEKLQAILAKAQSVEITTPTQISQVENMGGSTDEVVKRTVGIDQQIDAVKAETITMVGEVQGEASEGVTKVEAPQEIGLKHIEDNLTPFYEKAKQIATVEEGHTNIDSTHKGTFADQRRMEESVSIYEDRLQGLPVDLEQRQLLVTSVARLKEAIENNKAWIEARLNNLTPEDREKYLDKEEELSSNVRIAQFSLNDLKADYKERRKMNDTATFDDVNSRRIVDELWQARKALETHELSLIPLSSKPEFRKS